jgi:hypothetical protein
MKFNPNLKPINVPIVETLDELHLFINNDSEDDIKSIKSMAEKFEHPKLDLNQREYSPENYCLVRRSGEGSCSTENELVITLEHVSINYLVFLGNH